MDIALMIVIIIAAAFSVFYSIKTRQYRKEGNFDIMKYYNSKANIGMGIMLIAMATVQFIAFGAESTARVVVGSAFLLLGAFNLYAGIRNYRIYTPKVHK